MIGWIILGLVGFAVCAAFIFDDPWWQTQARVWEHEDQIAEAEQDHRDWKMKQGKYAARAGEVEE